MYTMSYSDSSRGGGGGGGHLEGMLELYFNLNNTIPYLRCRHSCQLSQFGWDTHDIMTPVLSPAR